MRALASGFVALVLTAVAASAQTPISGHYPPGQSGLRGGASPPVGWGYTNFSRAFTNLEVKGEGGETVRTTSETRFANISMFTWITNVRILGLRYGALAGIPFSTGNLNPAAGDLGSKSFGLGDVLITPVALYHAGDAWDAQFQFTVWTASGHFEPGGADNRGAGFPALVYSLGTAWYPGGDRQDWSVSAIARLEQNFEQEGTGTQPGDDVVVDWGLGKTLRTGERPIEAGVSGFAVWQLSRQEAPAAGPYRYFGAGPEASATPWAGWTLRLRAQWEFGTVNAVRGNNLWFIVHHAF